MANFRRISRGPQLQAKLTKLRTGVQAPVEAGLLKAGEIVNAEQKRLVPEDEGDLKDSLKYYLGRGEKTGNQAVRILATDFKAPWIEFGTKRKDQGGRAQPFFFPGFRATRRRARTAISKSVREAVLKAVK